jgi:type IVB pilus formation R64 PilN family outer membrane protein
MAWKRMLQTKGVLGCLLVASLCFGLAGCERQAKFREQIDQKASEAKESLAEASKQPSGTVAYDPLTVTNRIWHGSTARRLHRGVPLPASFEQPRGVTLVSSEEMSLGDMANAISSQTGIPVRLTSLAVPARNVGTNSAANSPTASAAPDMPVSYEGSLSGLLDRISAHFGISWRYDGASITISRFETRIFVVEALPGTQEVNEGIKDAEGGGGGGGGGSGTTSSGGTNLGSVGNLIQNSKTEIALKYWEELAAVLNSIVAGQGSAIVSPTMGTVTVTTTADVMGTVADYLAKENKRLSRQIAINVEIYSVNLGESEDYSVAFTGFLKHLDWFSGMNYASPSTLTPVNAGVTASSMGNFSIAILNSAADNRAHIGNIFKALSTVGNTTTVARFPMTTLNNHPVSRRVGTDTNYIASVTAITATGTTSQTTFTPIVDTIRDGFSLQLTPRLLDDGRILLQYSLGLVGIETMGQTTFNQGGGIETPLSLPVTDNRIFVQQSMLRSGQTLVIGGVDQRTTSHARQGVGSPNNFLLGGGTSADEDHLMMVIAMTPYVMDLATHDGGGN